MKANKKINLPKKISFQDFAKNTDIASSLENCNSLEIDMSKTVSLHISVIGYLIDLKQKLEKKDANLIIKLSNELKNTFEKLDLVNFFNLNMVK